MRQGGRYIDDGKGGVKLVDPKSEQHHQYPPAKTNSHPATAGDEADAGTQVPVSEAAGAKDTSAAKGEK